VRLMLLLITVFIALTITGCAGVGLERDGNALGTHKYEVAPDGTVSVDTRSLRGAPDVEIQRPDGTVVRILSSDAQNQLGKLLLQSLTPN